MSRLSVVMPSPLPALPPPSPAKSSSLGNAYKSVLSSYVTRDPAKIVYELLGEDFDGWINMKEEGSVHDVNIDRDNRLHIRFDARRLSLRLSPFTLVHWHIHTKSDIDQHTYDLNHHTCMELNHVIPSYYGVRKLMQHKWHYIKLTSTRCELINPHEWLVLHAEQECQSMETDDDPYAALSAYHAQLASSSPSPPPSDESLEIKSSSDDAPSTSTSTSSSPSSSLDTPPPPSMTRRLSHPQPHCHSVDLSFTWWYAPCWSLILVGS